MVGVLPVGGFASSKDQFFLCDVGDEGASADSDVLAWEEWLCTPASLLALSFRLEVCSSGNSTPVLARIALTIALRALRLAVVRSPSRDASVGDFALVDLRPDRPDSFPEVLVLFFGLGDDVRWRGLKAFLSRSVKLTSTISETKELVFRPGRTVGSTTDWTSDSAGAGWAKDLAAVGLETVW